MAKKQTQYICQTCGSAYSQWQGQCQDCHEWGTIKQEITEKFTILPTKSKNKPPPIEMHDLQGIGEDPKRYKSQIGELDRVLGGGIVPGSVVLLGGDPGIGKSTLLLQAVAKLSENYKCAYFSGEESVEQIRMRARRLGYQKAKLQLAALSQVERICEFMQTEQAEIIVIDSIQTVYIGQLDNAPGSVAQVRASAHEIIKTAKTKNIALFIVGHVTKDGSLAGPRLLEHMVDAVLYFEGERTHPFRILRGVKNRYATTDEIGVFDMGTQGLQEVLNPSELFLTERQNEATGSAVFAGMEGTRPLLVEVQALVTSSYLPIPRRSVVGYDGARLSMLLAVLERRLKIRFGSYDAYVNIVGGLKLSEPAADLAVAAALLSAIFDVSLPAQAVFFGELGLSGEIRRVQFAELRLREAHKLGFTQAITPPLKDMEVKQISSLPNALKINSIQSLKDLLDYFPRDKLKSLN